MAKEDDDEGEEEVVSPEKEFAIATPFDYDCPSREMYD